MTISSPHLTPEELIDVAEGTCPEAAAPHLAACATCRRQLAELRSSIALLRDVDVPEPPPLYWNQFSRRLVDAIAADPPSSGWIAALRPRWLIPMAATALAAALIVAALKPSERVPNAPPIAVPVAASPAADAAAALVLDIDADRSLELVADLTAHIDLGDAIDAGLTSREGAEHAVTQMNAEELAVLQRLLTEAMARRGA